VSNSIDGSFDGLRDDLRVVRFIDAEHTLFLPIADHTEVVPPFRIRI
jgi:hypothetical protein